MSSDKKSPTPARDDRGKPEATAPVPSAKRTSMAALFVSMLPGFLPLILYMVVEAFAGEQIAIVSAIVFGIGEVLWILAREKRLELMALVDTMLLISLGAVSLLQDNGLLFKLKPALLDVIFAVLFFLSAWGKRDLIWGRFTAKSQFAAVFAQAAPLMKRWTAGLGFVMVIHAVLTAAAALWASQALWDFVAGAGFFILPLVWIGLEILYLRNRARRRGRP